jgi:hypothetical protein
MTVSVACPGTPCSVGDGTVELGEAPVGWNPGELLRVSVPCRTDCGSGAEDDEFTCAVQFEHVLPSLAECCELYAEAEQA